MSEPISAGRLWVRTVAAVGSALVLAAAGAASAQPAAAPTAPTAAAQTPMGRLAADLVAHLNRGGADQLRQWSAGVVSAKMAASDRADLDKDLATAAAESGGVELVGVRPSIRSPGSVVASLRTKHGGRFALLIIEPDPAQPDRLLRAGFLPAQDPQMFAAWPSGPTPPAKLTELVGGALDQLVRSMDFSGCVTVTDGTRTLFDQCRGPAERNFAVVADGRTKFHIGSMDKMFTAVAIAQLVEAGKMSWDSTLAELVPDYPDQAAARQITVWQLLHHRAGLGDFFVPEFFAHREKFVDPADYLDLIARQPRVGPAGQQWAYSNAGFILLGRIVEKVSGEGYFAYVQRHVFAPAGMAATGFDSQADVTPGLAVGYYHDDPFAMGAWKANWMTLPFKGSPAGGGYSTTIDLLAFARALRAGALVRPATLARMFEDEAAMGPAKSYATGLEDRMVAGRHIRGHSGGAPGMNADLALVWETGAAVAVTSNEDGPTAQGFADRIADLLAAQGGGAG